MANYDFSSLNDKEFESLSTDVLSAHMGQHIERFKSGKDGGVDGRFFSAQDEEVIIQCKHWLKSGLSALLSSLSTSEAEKVRKLNPKRYIFVTSLELSRANKIKIKEIFSPFILSEADILGNEDVNDILSKNLSIEQKHYKLWLTSTNVLKIILDAAIIGRSKFKLEEIVKEFSLYVVTENHNEALKKLEQLHTIIIKGAPGIGKTMLADQLCQYYAAHGYELCYIENSLNEAESHYDESRKQVFYFDDFLGRNFLLALAHHQDSHVVNFIRRVQSDPKKRFILTSRSNILNQGKRLSDLFEIKHIDKNEYELLIGSLSDYDKAMILYNHIWFSQLEESFIDEIYKEKRYKLIIKHKNFNPRLISFITDSHVLKGIDFDSYWTYIEETLNHPKGVWHNVFDVQLDDICRHIVVAIVIHGRKISETDIQKFFYKLKSSDIKIKADESFESVMRVLSGALLNRTIISRTNSAKYDLFNPSIADYVLSTYCDDVEYLEQILSCLRTEASVDNLRSLYRSRSISKPLCEELIKKLLLKEIYDLDSLKVDIFLIRLLSFSADILTLSKEVHNQIEKVSEKLLSSEILPISYHTWNFIDWAINQNVIQDDDTRLIDIIEDRLLNDWLDEDEYSPLSKVIWCIEVRGGHLTDMFKKQYTENYVDLITQKVIEADVLPDVYDESFDDYTEITDFVKDELTDIYIDFTDSEIENISCSCDMDKIVDYNIETSSREDQRYEQAGEASHSVGDDSAIDDLFDRG